VEGETGQLGFFVSLDLDLGKLCSGFDSQMHRLMAFDEFMLLLGHRNVVPTSIISTPRFRWIAFGLSPSTTRALTRDNDKRLRSATESSRSQRIELSG
jgi:hypothetical protein